jgi:predicted O-methyltransferase YrrM
MTLASLTFQGRNKLVQLRRLLGDVKAKGSYGHVYTPNQQTLSFIAETKSRSIAEIGVFEGHTSVEIAKVLNGVGELHLFDRQDKVADVGKRISALGFRNFKAFGCSYKTLDSYNWHLAKLIEKHDAPIYDYVFLDGCHTFAVEALAFFLCDRLLKVGGHVDFDDYEWTLAGSPSMNPRVYPKTAEHYTPEQIETKQIAMIVDTIVKKSGRYAQVVKNKIFKKLA